MRKKVRHYYWVIDKWGWRWETDLEMQVRVNTKKFFREMLK